MIKKNKQIILTIVLGILILFIFTGDLLSLVIANESQKGFDNPPCAQVPRVLWELMRIAPLRITYAPL